MQTINEDFIFPTEAIAERNAIVMAELPEWTLPKPDDHRHINALLLYLSSLACMMFLFEIVPINLAHTNRPL